MPDAQLIGILIAAMVAGVVLFRLYTVLGRRTGHEPQNGKPSDRGIATAPLRDVRPAPAIEMPAEMPGTRPDGSPARSLLDIELADRSFDRDHFLKGARTAYELVQKAYADADRLALRPLVSEEVYAAFNREIAARPGAPARLTTIGDARIADADLSNNVAEITVSFRATFTEPDGTARDALDRWSFARTIGAADPNWVLVATSGESA